MKDLLLAHVEKGVLAICLLLLVYFVYSALAHETYKKSPEDFSKVTQQAKENVQRSKVPAKNLETIDLPNIAKELKAPIDAQPYQFRNAWRRPFDFGLNFRKEPKVIRPDKPVVQGNRGLFTSLLVDPEGRPLRKKVKKNAGDKLGLAGINLDFRAVGAGGGGNGALDEGGAVAEAREETLFGNQNAAAALGFGTATTSVPAQTPQPGVTPPADAGPAAPIINVRRRKGGVINNNDREAQAKKAAELANAAKEEVVEEPVVGIVGKHFVEIVSAYPNSELITEFVQKLTEPAKSVGLFYAYVEVQRRELDRSLEWTNWTKIDFAKQFDIIQRSALGFEPEQFPQVTIPGLAMNIPQYLSLYRDFLVLDQFRNPEIAVYPQDILQPDRFRKRKAKKDGTVAKAFGGNFEAKPGVVGLQPGAKPVTIPNPNDPANKDKKAPAFDNHYQVKYAMIRFLDFTVEPDRRYQYRFRVVVHNPNLGRADVANADFAKNPYLYSDWSEPSDEVYVESDIVWYALERDLRTDRASLEVHHWSRKFGEWIVANFKQRVGDLIGITNPPKVISIRKWDDDIRQMSPTEIQTDTEFFADSVLVDITGGKERFSGKTINGPTEIVAVNEFGDLVRHGSDRDNTDSVRRAVARGYEDLVADIKGQSSSQENNLFPPEGSTKKAQIKFKMGVGGGGGNK